ncbi:MAG TPA: PAS domain S-box protein [Prolixibacteraceae bacterium]|jgi:PAS domain S-box-containing protein
MKRDKTILSEALSFRHKAEEQLKAKQTINTTPIKTSSDQSQSEGDILKCTNELQVRLMELELQNEELRHREARFKTLLANIGDVISIMEPDGTIQYMSPNIENYFGWKPEEITGANRAWDLVHPEDKENLLEAVLKLMKAEHTTVIKVFRVKCKDGSWKWVETTGVNRVNDPNIQGILTTYRDISDRKIIEDQAIEQKRFFEQMFSQSSVSTQILDKEGWCEKINSKVSDLFGVKPEDIEGKKYNIFKDESIRKEGIIPILNKVFLEGKTATWDVFFDIGVAAESQHIKVADKNMKRWFHNWAHPIFDEQGQLAHVIIQHTDITKRRSEQEMLSNSEARYRRLFESAQDGILILNAESGQIVDVNLYLIQMLGYSHSELLGKELWEIGVFKNITESKEAFIELQDRGYIRFDNMPLETKKGKPINVEFVSNVYLVDQIKVIQCNIRDITERLKAEKEIQTLGKAIEQGPSSIIITDADGKIEFVNNKFTAMSLYNLQEVKGKNPRIFNPGRLPENEYIELWETLKEGKTWEGEVLNRRKDKTYFWEEVSISAVKKPDGTISNYILIQNDISEKKRIMTDLIVAKEKAEESDRLKSAFLANMSHEIRTPLNSIIGFSELMSDPDFDFSQHNRFNQIINNSGTKLLSIITDIMDLSKIEAGEVQIDKRPLSVNQLVIAIQKEYAFKAIEKDIELKLDLLGTDEIAIESDENKLRQILFNFVGNALKFTDKGFVEIGIKVIEDFIQFHVKDTGIGIPPEFQTHIFERFRQVESAFTRKHGGNGLGLAISKALIELLGGKVWLDTEQGIGSTFYFTIPINH